MASATTIPLREWIKRALECTKSNADISGGCGHDALSWEYLLGSLKIAISLSDEIKNAEDLASVGFLDGMNMLPKQRSNGSMPDWAEFAAVRLKIDRDSISDEEHCERSSIPNEPILHFKAKDLGIGSESHVDQSGLQTVTLNFVDRLDENLVVPSCGLGSSTVDRTDQDQDEQRCLDVHFAYIADTDNDTDDCYRIVCSDSFRDKCQRIYMLGLVFYELFSGGERPPPELWIGTSSLMEPFHAAAKNTPASLDFDSSRGMQAFAGRFFHEEIDIFSDPLNRHDVVGCEERFTQDPGEKCNGFEIRKRRSTVHSSRGYSEHTQGETKMRAAFCKATPRVLIEQLHLKGVPSSLCRMIYNMIDIINGDFSGNESYSNISDVIYDLNLMVEDPQRFLRDLDVDAVCLKAMTLNENIFIRDHEFESLQSVYGRFVSGTPEIALIAGESGTGKTWLANRFGRFIVSCGGVLIEGKFNRLHRAQPFSVLAMAFGAYCDMLIQEADRERSKLIATKLQEALGPDACQLVKVIPNLSEIIYCKELNDDSYAPQNFIEAENRIYYLMCRFVETISSCSDCIIALFLDDLQWADDVSISTIGEILKSSDTSNRFFFFGCYRDDEIEDSHSFFKMIQNVQGLGVTARTIKLECIDKSMMTRMLSNILCLSPRLVRSLSDILFHKAKGNPLFFSQLLLSLNRDGLLYLNRTHCRWEWDDENIMSRNLPDDVAVLFTERLSALPLDVKFALYTVSCFGASIEVDVIEKLEASLGDRLIDPLNHAEKRGFVSIVNANYQFCHDRIQEAAYSMIAEEERCLYHMKYGLSLAELSFNANDNNRILFIAVGQINRGGPSAVSNEEERLKIVKFNLAAGKMAIDMSEFHSAFDFLDNGITFLDKTHWRDDYNLSLELYELAAECALTICDFFSLTVLIDQVMKNASCFEDTLNISYICMSSLGYASKISDSLEMGLRILSELGEELTESFPNDYIELRVSTTKARLEEMSLIDLVPYRMMTDKKKLTAMKFLRRMKPVIQQVNPKFLPIVTLKMVDITVEYGMSPMSPIGFAYFGSILAKLGDINGGYKFTSLAKSLVDRMKLREIAGEVFCVSTDVLSCIEPLRIVSESRKESEAIALAAGDVTWACYSRLMYASDIFWYGSKLSLSVEVVTQARRFVMSRGHLTTDNYLMILQESMLKIKGATDSETFSNDHFMERVFDSNNPLVLSTYYFQTAYVSYIFDDYERMKEMAEEFFQSSVNSWILMSIHIFHVLICGLVSFRVYRETKIPLWLERGTKLKSQLQLWAGQGSSRTFENKCFLLEAEEQYSNNNDDDARVVYAKAISSAKVHKLVHEEAMAHELAANFYFSKSDFSTSLECYTSAHEKYCEWGAYAKANSLYKCIQEKFSSYLGAPSADCFERRCFDSEADQRKRKQQ